MTSSYEKHISSLDYLNKHIILGIDGEIYIAEIPIYASIKRTLYCCSLTKYTVVPTCMLAEFGLVCCCAW